jgi:hypothetical protein
MRPESVFWQECSTQGACVCFQRRVFGSRHVSSAIRLSSGCWHEHTWGCVCVCVMVCGGVCGGVFCVCVCVCMCVCSAGPLILTSIVMSLPTLRDQPNMYTEKILVFVRKICISDPPAKKHEDLACR